MVFFKNLCVWWIAGVSVVLVCLCYSKRWVRGGLDVGVERGGLSLAVADSSETGGGGGFKKICHANVV